MRKELNETKETRPISLPRQLPYCLMPIATPLELWSSILSICTVMTLLAPSNYFLHMTMQHLECKQITLYFIIESSAERRGITDSCSGNLEFSASVDSLRWNTLGSEQWHWLCSLCCLCWEFELQQHSTVLTASHCCLMLSLNLLAVNPSQQFDDIMRLQLVSAKRRAVPVHFKLTERQQSEHHVCHCSEPEAFHHPWKHLTL